MYFADTGISYADTGVCFADTGMCFADTGISYADTDICSANAFLAFKAETVFAGSNILARYYPKP